MAKNAVRLPHFDVGVSSFLTVTRLRAAVLFEIAFYVAYRFGMSFTHDLAAPFWAPDAVLLSALLLTRRRDWWFFILAPLPIRLWTSVPSGASLWFLLAVYANDSMKALMSAWLLQSEPARRDWFDGLRQYVKYFVIAVAIVPAISACAGAAARFAIGYDFWPAWTTWFLGDSLANLMLTPGLICLVCGYNEIIRRNLRQHVEPVLNAIGLGLAGYFAFFSPPATISERPFILYLQEPFLLWASMRSGPIGASATLTLIGLLSLYGTLAGGGPFHFVSTESSVVSIQLFLFVLSTPFMFLSVIIRQQRKTEMALYESERRFRSLVDSIPVMVWMAGEDAGCTFFSKPWLDFTGRPLQRQLGDGWMECIHVDDREAFEHHYLSAFNARQDFTFEYRLLHHSGVHRWVLDCGIPRYAPDGSFLGYVGGCIDIVYRKEAEEKLRQMGVELIHAQETERQRIGQELHDDLAQRLSALSMRLSALAQNQSARKEFLREIEILRKHAMDLCKDVSNLSHRLRPPTLLGLGLRPALRNLCEQSTSTQLNVTYAVEEGLPRITEEVSVSLYRVAQEALRNAQKHSGANSVHMDLRVEGAFLSISVRDNGCGFVPGATLTHGLGLSSMADRTQRIGGNLAVTSSPGNGTTITAYVPIDVALSVASESA